MTIGTGDAERIIHRLRMVIQQHLTTHDTKYLKRSPIQKALTQLAGYRWNPKYVPYVNAAMILEGYVPVRYVGHRMYKDTHYTKPSASD